MVVLTPARRSARAPARIAVAAGWLLAGCGFLDAVSEASMGEGDVPRITLDYPLPSAEDLMPAAITAGSAPGAPASWERATLAHLVGLMRLQGTCRATRTVPGDAHPIVSIEFGLANCDAVEPCGGLCPPGFDGAVIELRTTVQLLDEDDVAALRSQLSQLTESAIVQIRLRVFELAFVQDPGTADADATGGPSAQRRANRPLEEEMTAFALKLSTAGAPSVTLVREEHLPSIAPATPQRFELPPGAELTHAMKRHVLAAEPFQITLTHDALLPRAALYGTVLGETRLVEDIQPEFVISVLEAVDP